MSEAIAIILAAGKSKRMMSEIPKVLHPACGRPMVEYVLDAARSAGAKRIIVVVGHKAEVVEAALKHHPDVEFALQAEQKGTGHAVMMCRDAVGSHHGPVLSSPETLRCSRGPRFRGCSTICENTTPPASSVPLAPRTTTGWAASFATRRGIFSASSSSATPLPKNRRSPKSIPAVLRMTASRSSGRSPRFGRTTAKASST